MCVHIAVHMWWTASLDVVAQLILFVARQQILFGDHVVVYFAQDELCFTMLVRMVTFRWPRDFRTLLSVVSLPGCLNGMSVQL